MNAPDPRTELPRFALPVVAGLLLVTLLYSVLVFGNVVVWLALWGGLFGIGAALFVIYLLYRLVLAVERIADGR
jgi:hypothetical protein